MPLPMMRPAAWTRRSALAALLGAGLQAPAFAAAGRAVRALGQRAPRVARPTQAVLQAVCRVGSQRLLALGERGLVILSDDGGNRWIQADVPVSTTLTAARFLDDKRGWIVGNMGVVLETLDGGATWAKRLDGVAAAELAMKAARIQLQASKLPAEVTRASVLAEDAQRLVGEGPDKPFLGVGMHADGALLAVGAYGLALSSVDAGRSWQSDMHRLPNPDGLTYYGCAERGEERWLYGEQGLLLKAEGRRRTFVAEESPARGSLFGAVALREGPLLLLGLRGRAWRSAAVGEPWHGVQTPVDAALIAGTQLGDGTVLLVGAAGQALHSRDGGQSFAPLALAQRFPFTGAVQAPDGGVVLVGMRGLVRLSAAELAAAAARGGPSSPSSSSSSSSSRSNV